MQIQINTERREEETGQKLRKKKQILVNEIVGGGDWKKARKKKKTETQIKLKRWVKKTRQKWNRGTMTQNQSSLEQHVEDMGHR